MNKRKSVRCMILFLAFLVMGTMEAQHDEHLQEDVYVDGDGVMRWGHNDKEVKGFGVNYSVPFAHAYRAAKKSGVDLKKAIAQDVYHFSRLGFDLYRIHVWDTEISDAEGNLLENQHLELFDYLLKQLKDRGINFVITPIAYWGNGWPEPDEETPGFSNKYGKAGSLTHPEAIKAQENYLAQFLKHKNPYTGIAYKDEPGIIAFEISNEPHHKGDPEEVAIFIQKMVTSMRSTGTKKPIFYNVSHSTHLAQAYFDADIQGGTFQWYPTGLGFEKELEGNLLPNVNDYDIPFDDVLEKNNAAKLVYEFDAADVMKSYIYPAMARSFREAGIQIATHFAYDPTYMAYANTEYDTHYMNLAYTPKKALALMIAGEIFHQIPMNSDTGAYPENLGFGDFSIDYEKDLAAFNSGEKLIYTSSNALEPKAPEDLRQIAGFGDSEVVNYEGRGAYFLDRLEQGAWRLEIMPDAVLVENPFGDNSLKKTIGVISWKDWEMRLDLPGLGGNFHLVGLNEGNELSIDVTGGTFSIQPGTYLLTAPGVDVDKTTVHLINFGLNEFSAPEATVEKTYLLHEPVKEISENSALEISAEIVSNKKVERAEAWLQNGNIYERVELSRKKGYAYSAVIPRKLLKSGFLEYQVVVKTEEGNVTFPAGADGRPSDWDFFEQGKYKTSIIPEKSPLYIFNAADDHDFVVGQWLPTIDLVPTSRPGEAEYQVNVEQLFKEDEENKNATPAYDYSFRYNFSKKIAGRVGELEGKGKLIFNGRALNDQPLQLQVALLMKNAVAFGKIIEIGTAPGEYTIELAELSPVSTVTLPRPYPSFLPYYLEHSYRDGFKLEEVESIQFSIGPGMGEDEIKEPHGLGIIDVRLE